MDSQPAETIRCGRCHRPLRAATSRRDGYGRGCKTILRAAATAAAIRGFAQRQIDAARELIEDRAVVATRRPGVFRVVSSDGTRTYLAHSDTCNCDSGLRRLTACTCKHSLAVRMILA